MNKELSIGVHLPSYYSIFHNVGVRVMARRATTESVPHVIGNRYIHFFISLKGR